MEFKPGLSLNRLSTTSYPLFQDVECQEAPSEHSREPEQPGVSSSSPSHDEHQLKDGDIINIIMAYAIRHSLSRVAVGDLLDMLRLLGVTNGIPPSKYLLLKPLLEEVESGQCIHYYCSRCLSYINVRETSCQGCGHPFSKANATKNGDFFVYIPIHDQVKELLESGFIKENLVTCEREHGVMSDTVDGEFYHLSTGQPSDSLDKLTLSWNFDGLPIYKSSGASLWPILLQVSELKPSVRKEQMLMCGLWFGSQKPLWATYSKPFIDELTELSTVGIKWHQHDQPGVRVTKVGSHAITCDAPARCMVQGISQFNGAFGCAWCLQEGTVVPKGNGICRVYKYECDVPKRTHSNVIASAKTLVEQKLTHHNGVKTATPLLLLPDSCGVDVVRSFAVDYMHAVLLGVVRMFLDLWFGSKWSAAPFSIRGSLTQVDNRLLNIRPPHDLSRTPRTLADFKQWKASECRNWLLYYSVPTMLAIMPSRYMEHWCSLVGAIYSLLLDDVHVDSVGEAERALLSFVKGTETLYGEEYMSSNVHSLLHLGECVRSFGPLWAVSAFPYEGFMIKLKQLFSGTTYLTQQVANNFLILQLLKKNIAAPESDARVSALASKWLGVYSPCREVLTSSEGAVGLGAGRMAEMDPRERRVLHLNGCTVPETSTARYFDRAIVGGSVCCTQEHGKSHKRNSFTLFTKYGVGRVQSICFVGARDCYIFLTRDQVVEVGLPLRHMCGVVNTDALMMCRPSEVICNAVVIEAVVRGHSTTIYAKQPNRIEKD